MTDMTSTLAPGPSSMASCSERHQQLLMELAQVVSEYHRMQTAQLQAVISGADFPFEDWIAEAAARHEQAKLAVRAYRAGARLTE